MAMDSKVVFQTDCVSIVSQIKDQDEHIRLKRRWLLGCDLSESDNRKTDFLKSDQFLPESFLREDDIFYETIKARVEEAFGFRKNEQVCNAVQQNDSKICTSDVVKELDMNLDSLTSKALYLIAMIITKGFTSFDKTRKKMKEIIRESIRKKKDDIGITDIVKQLHQVLSVPRNFQRDCMMSLDTATCQSHRDAAMKVLNELDKLSTQTLLAMKRKLKGSRMIPKLKTSRCGQSRSNLIKQVRQASEQLISELSPGDKLPDRLARAMSLVDLSCKITPGYKTTIATDLFQFSPEIKNVQNDIVKALWLLHKVRFRKLKKLHHLLEPETQVSKDSLRCAVRKLLIEYLFECSEMESTPSSLIEALSLVNRSGRNVEHKLFPNEAIEEETECILNVSAQLKQIFWECIPHHDQLDQNFADAYMEELEDSDDDDDDAYENCSFFEVKDTVEEDSYGSDHEESVAECSVLDPTATVVIRDLPESSRRVGPRSLYVTPTSNISDTGTSKNRVTFEREIEMKVDNQKTDDRDDQKQHIRNKNQYLAAQEISDETSMVAYNLIGCLLERFADQKGLDLEADERSYLGGKTKLQEDTQGKKASSKDKSDGSITFSVVKKLMPFLEQSVLMKVQELMDLS